MKIGIAAYYREQIRNVSLPCSKRILENQHQIATYSRAYSRWKTYRPNMLGEFVIGLIGKGTVQKMSCKIKLDLVTTRLMVLCALSEMQNGTPVTELSDLVPEYFDTIPVNPETGGLFTMDDLDFTDETAGPVEGVFQTSNSPDSITRPVPTGSPVTR